MFDKTIVNKGETFAYAKEVNHKYAPTTDQVRYLKELEQAALDKIIESQLLQVKHFDAGLVVTEVDFDPVNIKRHFMVSFKLNGKKISVNVPVDDGDLDVPEDHYYRIVFKHVSKAIAEQIFISASDSIFRDAHFRRAMR